jgi:predicted glycosyltransferase
MGTVGAPTIPRVMFYSHDGYGLGHLSRTLALARHFRARWSTITQLVVTGSPLPQNWFLPDDADYIKLPSVTKLGDEQFASRSLTTSFGEVRELRRDILLSAVRHFEPSALIVDYMAAGLKGELVPALRYLKQSVPDSRLVLGLRDVVDKPSRVRRRWARDGVYDLLDNLYDQILVYGQEDVYDVISEYGLSPRAAAKTCYVGYLGRESPNETAEQIRKKLVGQSDGLVERLVLVTAGGGGDGHALLHSMLQAFHEQPGEAGFKCLLVCGPLMSAEERRRLKRLASGSTVRVLDYLDDLPSYVAAADAVVSMGGYNSICEILSFNKPAVIVPRVGPSKEQLIRAKALSRRGLVRMIHPSDVTPGRLLDEINQLLNPLRAPASGELEMNGLHGVAAELERLLSPSGAPNLPVPIGSGVA